MGTMFALDLLARDDAGGRPRLEGRAPLRRKRVVILGAGMAGMATAFELGQLGYDCTILEARARPGGRCWTVRGGTEETDLTGEKQVCRFDTGQFFNAGPMRVPHHHGSTLAYCREFGIPLVVFTNFNEAAYVHRDSFPKMRLREVRTDWRGHTAELLAKTVQKNRLDTPLTKDDREKLIEYLRAEGRLNSKLAYSRDGDVPATITDPDSPRGFAVAPGSGEQTFVASKPVDLEMLIKSGYSHALEFGHIYNQQSTMLTPAGGMDRLAYGFAERLGPAIRHGAVVREVRRTADGGVRVRYATSGDSSALQELAADFCVCTLPPALAGRLGTDFSPATVAALQLPLRGAAGKIGLQFRRRFWEEDEQIYGGMTHTDQPIAQICYPFGDYGSRGKGVLLGYYHFGPAKAQLDDLPHAERERRALAQGAKIHPQYPAEFENSFSIAWHQIAHNESPWVEWRNDDDFKVAQRAFADADGPFYFAGDWLSYLNGWQAGAFLAAHRVCRQLHARALAD